MRLPGCPSLQHAICSGPGDTLLVAGRYPPCIWLYTHDAQLVQCIGNQQLGLKPEEEGRGIGCDVTSARVLLHVGVVFSASSRLHVYRLA